METETVPLVPAGMVSTAEEGLGGNGGGIVTKKCRRFSRECIDVSSLEGHKGAVSEIFRQLLNVEVLFIFFHAFLSTVICTTGVFRPVNPTFKHCSSLQLGPSFPKTQSLDSTKKIAKWS